MNPNGSASSIEDVQVTPGRPDIFLRRRELPPIRKLLVK
jgi:hypothetical protein